MKRKLSVGLIILFLSLQACSSLRTELYREETLHGYQNACKLYKEGNYTDAESGFEEVTAMDPDYGPAHAALGHLALIREDYPGALRHYQDAIAAAPELEADLQPFIMVALAHQKRASLQQAGISLNQLYPLIMGDRLAEVETILAKDIPLKLLAGDTVGLTPGRLGEMQQKIAATADPLSGSVRYRLFAGYLLFFGQRDDDAAAALIHAAAAEAKGKARQEALIVLGKLHERKDEPNAAVEAYLAAVDAGLADTEVAHHLARVYGVDVESILQPGGFARHDLAPTRPMGIEMVIHLPPAPSVNLGTLAEPKQVSPAVPSGSRQTF